MSRRRIIAGFAALLLAGIMPAVPAWAAPDAAVAIDRQVDDLLVAAKASMMIDAAKSLDLARQAENAAGRASPRHSSLIVNAQWLQGEALIRLNKPDRAAPIIDAALAWVRRHQPGSKLDGDLHMAHGRVATAFGRVQVALDDFQQAHAIFHKIGEARGQAVALQNIASLYQNAGDFERVLHYHRQSAEVFSGDPQLTLSGLNNQANALAQLGRYREAEAEYRRALAVARKLDSPMLEAVILNNIARAQIRRGDLGGAQLSIDRGLSVTGGTGGSWRPLLLATKAQLELERHQPRRAVALLADAFAGIDLATTTDAFREAHRTAYLAHKVVGNDRDALAHLEAFQRLDSQSQALVASTNAALMAARFDFASQDLKIAKLRAGQLERDVLLARSRARQNLIIVSGLLALTIVVVALLALYIGAMRRSRNQIRAVNDNLTAANVALEKALLAKTEFLATTSHEIRTPLNGILGMTQIMLADGTLAPDLRERVSMMHGAGETMRALVDDILDLSKMETGHLRIHPVDMNLALMLNETMAFWRAQAQAKGLTITLTADVPDRIVEDEGRLRQILFNLMSNAIKFTSRGGVTLQASVEDGGESAGEALRIDVADQGIGIPEEAFETIFEKFQQLDGGRARQFGGTGLGLAICRNLAEAMGGRLGVASRVGEGSTFTLRLPLRRAAARRDPAPPDGQGAEGLGERRLLVVGANPIVQSMLRTMLEPRLREIAFVADIDAARTADIAPGDIVLVEGGSLAGGEAERLAPLCALAGTTRATKARLALLWPSPDTDDRARLRDCGVDLVIAKPIGGEALLAALRSLAGDAIDGDGIRSAA